MNTVTVRASSVYDILIEKGSLAHCGAYAKRCISPGCKAAIITDDTVASLYLDCVRSSFEQEGFTVSSFVFPHGEDSKCEKTLFEVYDFLAESTITRSDFIVALGGGVVGDLAGFAAATYQRGIAFMQIPTTFLAAIDSSVGGKTAINIPAGKNLVGAFYQPFLVVCDTDTFDTLPEETFADGVAEMIKYGLIASDTLFERIEQGNIRPDIDDIVTQCVSIKRDVVEQDEHDTGLRMILNYGHTFGHAIEKATNHRITHGHAVALGMVLIARLGERMGLHSSELTHRIEQCIASYGLPIEYEGDLPALSDGMVHDKKRFGSSIRLIFVKTPGKAEIFPIEVSELVRLLGETSHSMEYAVHGALHGSVTAPTSKSDLHRLMIAAALCPTQKTVISPYTMNEDIRATAGVMEAAGAKFEFSDTSITITGIDLSTPQQDFVADCHESGATLRFLVPVLSALGCRCTFIGQGKLPQRPMTPLIEEMEAHGISFSAPKLPFSVSGVLRAGTYTFPGNISSQYITGLLMALPLLSQDSEIHLTSALESCGYVNMTLSVLKRFRIRIDLMSPTCWHIPGGQSYTSPTLLRAEGDWSNAAFWLVAGALSGTVKTEGLDFGSLQGDRAICDILKEMGAEIKIEGNSVTVSKSELHAVTVDACQIPDLIPVVATAASFAKGTTHIINAGRLRLKESDRLSAVADSLKALGAIVEEGPDSLTITGQPQLLGGTVDSYNDHRMAMSMAVASLRCKQPVRIVNPSCVKKSYPTFFEEFKRLGGAVDVIDLGESH